MTLFRPDLQGFGNIPNMQLTVTNPKHLSFKPEDFLNQGNKINDLGEKIGAGAVGGTGSFGEAMLQTLDKVSAYQQRSSSLSQAALIDPDSVNVHDITIAQAEASMALSITRNVLSRMVQSWRDLINTR